MNRRTSVLGMCLLFAGASPAFALGLCTEVTEVTHTASDTTGTSLCDTPATFCGALFTASEAANGWCLVYDSPDATDPTHAQTRRLAEPSAATRYDSSAWPLQPGHPTRFGLGAVSVNGRCYVQYSCSR